MPDYLQYLLVSFCNSSPYCTLPRHRHQQPSHTQGLSQTMTRARVGQSGMCCNFFLADGFGFWQLDHDEQAQCRPLN